VGRCGHEISKVAIQKTGFPLSQDVVVLRVKNRARSEEVRRAFQTSPLLAPSRQIVAEAGCSMNPAFAPWCSADGDSSGLCGTSVISYDIKMLCR
jgi:hypothetical protein